MPDSKSVDLEDIIGMEKTGSVIAISRFIALRGIVTRKELRERFQSGSTRTTITHLKKLGLVYSRPGRNGFVVSIPWLLYLGETGADWKSIVKAKVPDVNEKELNEIEEALREAKKGPLGVLVRQLVRTSRYENLYRKQVERIVEVIPETCTRPTLSQRGALRLAVKHCCYEDRARAYEEQEDRGKRCEECMYSLLEYVSETYSQECIRPLLQYAQWLLALIPAIASRLYGQNNVGRLRELAEELVEQARELSGGATQPAWDVRLYYKTLYAVAVLLRELERYSKGYPKGAETLSEHYRKMLDSIPSFDKYNKNTVLRPFLRATIARILTAPPAFIG